MECVLVAACLAAPGAATRLVSTAGAHLELLDGRVWLHARDVSVSDILDLWSSVSGTTVVNGQQLPSTPVTLDLLGLPEREALNVLLREAAGYVLAERRDCMECRFVIDRIVVMPASASVPPHVAPDPSPVKQDEGEVDVPPEIAGPLRDALIAATRSLRPAPARSTRRRDHPPAMTVDETGLDDSEPRDQQ